VKSAEQEGRNGLAALKVRYAGDPIARGADDLHLVNYVRGHQEWFD